MDFWTIPMLILVILIAFLNHAVNRFTALQNAIKTSLSSIIPYVDNTIDMLNGLLDTLDDSHEAKLIIDLLIDIKQLNANQLDFQLNRLKQRVQSLIEANTEYDLNQLMQCYQTIENNLESTDKYIIFYNRLIYSFPYSIIANLMQLVPIKPIKNHAI